MIKIKSSSSSSSSKRFVVFFFFVVVVAFIGVTKLDSINGFPSMILPLRRNQPIITFNRQVSSGALKVNLSNPINHDHDDDDDNDDGDNIEGQDTTSLQVGQNLDCRDVRAKLVLQYRSEQQKDQDDQDSPATTGAAGPSSTTETLNDKITKNLHSGWAYEAGDVIETGSLIVSAPSQDFSCGGLKQQYFYKSCVLIVEHNAGFFTRGLIMNRATDRTVTDEYGNDWKLRFGGPMQGMDSTTDDVSFFCLHRLTRRKNSRNSSSKATKRSDVYSNNDNCDVDTKSLLSDFSIPINKDIAMTKWDIAQAIVASGDASVDDFILVAGYCGWNPGQLEDEVHRDNWFAVALDADSVFGMIKKQDQSSIPTGTDMWVQIMIKIGKGSMTSYTFKNKANVRFQDLMLQQWVRQRLANATSALSLSLQTKRGEVKKNSFESSISADRMSQQQQQQQQQQESPFSLIPPGTLFRATSPILLDNQVFHKSLVLIIETNEELMTGIVLNRPTTKSIVLSDKEVAIRYGGSSVVPGKERPTIWLHYNNEKLQNARVGEPLLPIKRKSNVFWRCNQQDAETAVEIGLASPADFLAVEGFSLWKRYSTAIAPSEERNLSFADFEECFSEVDIGAIPVVCRLLSTQEPLNKKNAAENMETANAAWMLAGDPSWLLSGSRSRLSQEQKEIQNLANSALDRWIRMFLL